LVSELPYQTTQARARAGIYTGVEFVEIDADY
jgi:hypothetical protein